MVGSTTATCPTKPRSTWLWAAVMRLASSPDMPDRQRPVHVDGRDDVAVDLAHQDHAGDVERLGVGHPQAVAELGLLAQAGHERADLRSPAVHHHGQDADGAHEHDILGERGQGVVGAARPAPFSALPPYLTTTILPRKRWM